MNQQLEGNMLAHLNGSIPSDVVNHQSSYYTVALEGWRRGLKLTFHNNQRGGKIPSRAHQYTLSDGKTSHRFFCARSFSISKETVLKAENKPLAYKHMKKAGVPIPETKTFRYNQNSIESICEYGEGMGYPLVVKPTNRGGGKGVYTNINNREDLKRSLMSVRDDLNGKRVIVERYFENAVDYRFYVMQDEVLAVSKSYSSNVIGDGKSNIEKLIENRNVVIEKNTATQSRKIKINDDMKEYLNSQNLSLESVPLKDERVFVREHGTYLGDRLNVDCTDEIDPKFKEYAVRALNSIPGLPCGSVDMIINEEANEGIVNEINSKGEIMMHVFPLEGKARDIPKAVIDFYFPDTPNERNENFYFEFEPIKDMFLTGLAEEITVPNIPENAEYVQNFVLKGKYLGPIYRRNLFRKAASMHLIGSLEKDDEGYILIKAIGSQEKLSKFENHIRNNSPGRSQIIELKVSKLSKFSGTSNINFEMK